MRKIVCILSIGTLLLAGCAAQQTANTHSVAGDNQRAQDVSATPERQIDANSENAPLNMEFSARKYDIDSPDSITVVVNKLRPLADMAYAPAELVAPSIPNVHGQPLRPEANAAMTQMYEAVKAATGTGFALCSGYRSYELQRTIYNRAVAYDGQAEADRFSARPGHSEHQTGLAIDIVVDDGGCALDDSFEVTPAGQWVKANAHHFGFILRYDKGLEPIVGFGHEQWHWRYVGVELATDMHNRGIRTLEEYFNLPPAPNYQQ